MNKVLSIALLFWCTMASFAQAPTAPSSSPRHTKSYVIADCAEKETDFVKEKCLQAGLDLGLPVLANRVATNSQHVAPKPSKHLLKQGTLRLQLAIDEKQTEFAVYHSDLFDIPMNINVLQIDNELITYRTTEVSGDIHLFYNCKRGAFGTKATAHTKNATVYKLWDTPERTLLPDLELQDMMAQKEAKRLSKTDYPLLIFNDLKSYGYNEQGDLAIGHFLDTMRKYNPGKLLQADLLTPMSAHYLDRVNENQLWNASMRTKIIETLNEKQDFYSSREMPWMIGNFQVIVADKNRKATTLEELEWFLSKATAYDAGFGLIFGAETMRKHGLTDTFLNTINHWETLRLNGAFGEAQKEAFKDPYGNWHIEKSQDSTYLLYPTHVSRSFYCDFKDDTWQWNSPYSSRFALRVTVEGKGCISALELRTPNGILYLPCTIKARQHLVFDYDGTAFIADPNYNRIQDVVPQGVSFLDEGSSEVTLRCEVKAEDKKQPEVTVRFFTRGQPETIITTNY